MTTERVLDYFLKKQGSSIQALEEEFKRAEEEKKKAEKEAREKARKASEAGHEEIMDKLVFEHRDNWLVKINDVVISRPSGFGAFKCPSCGNVLNVVHSALHQLAEATNFEVHKGPPSWLGSGVSFVAAPCYFNSDYSCPHCQSKVKLAVCYLM